MKYYNRLLFMALAANMYYAPSSASNIPEPAAHPSLRISGGAGHYEKCPKHRSNKIRKNRIRNKIARKSRRVNRKH